MNDVTTYKNGMVTLLIAEVCISVMYYALLVGVEAFRYPAKGIGVGVAWLASTAYIVMQWRVSRAVSKLERLLLENRRNKWFEKHGAPPNDLSSI
jgi:hypothetical protein